MAHDNLLRLSGPAVGNSVEAANIIATGDLAGGYRYAGKNKAWFAEVRCAGTFDRTTGDESLQIAIFEATDAAGTGAVQIAQGAVLTATNLNNYGSAVANGKAAGAPSDGPSYIGFATSNGGWIKARAIAAGTTPIVGNLSVNLIADNGGAYRQSGT